MKRLMLSISILVIIQFALKSQIEFGFKNAHIEALAGMSTNFSKFKITPFIGIGFYPFSVKTFGETKNQL